MASPIETLDACSAKLADAQRFVAKTRKVACVVSGVAVAGGFGLLLWKIFGNEPASDPAAAPAPPDGED